MKKSMLHTYIIHIPKIWIFLKHLIGNFIKHNPLTSEECRFMIDEVLA